MYVSACLCRGEERAPAAPQCGPPPIAGGQAFLGRQLQGACPGKSAAFLFSKQSFPHVWHLRALAACLPHKPGPLVSCALPQASESEEIRGLLEKVEKQLQDALGRLEWQNETVDHLLQTQLKHNRSKANSIAVLLKETASTDAT